MRQQFETDEYLARERRVAEKIEQAMGVQAMKLPKHYRADYALYKDGLLLRFCEVRIREQSYKTLRTSLAKWVALLNWAEWARLPSLLVVQWPEMTGVVVVKRSHALPGIVWGGRNDPRDDQDSEPLVEVPYERFESLDG